MIQPHPRLTEIEDRRGAQLFSVLIFVHFVLVFVSFNAINLFYSQTTGHTIWNASDELVIHIGLIAMPVAIILLRLGFYRPAVLIYIIDTAAVALCAPFLPSPNSGIALLATATIPILLSAMVFSYRWVSGILIGIVAVGAILFSFAPAPLREDGTWVGLLLVVAITGSLILVLRHHLDSIEEERLSQIRKVALKYRNLFDNIADGIFIVDLNGRIVEANSAASKQLDYTRDKLIGSLFAEISARPGFDIKSLTSELRNTGSLSYGTENKRKDGSIFPVALRLTLIEHQGDTSILAVAQDVTERKQFEEKLASSEKQYRELFDSVMEGIGLVDKDEVVVFANPAYAQIFEFDTTEEIVGKSLLDYVAPESRDILLAQSALRANGINSQYELSIVTAKGNLRWVYMSVTPQFAADGSYAGALGAVLDITEKKNSERVRAKIQQKLERAERMESLGLLAGGVAHDLNNMLGPVAGYSELLLREVEPDSKIAGRIKKIVSSAHDAADVIQDLLTLARRGRYEMKPLLLNDVITSYLESPGCEALQRRYPSIVVELNLCPDIGMMSGSSSHLSKVIMNLISNAFEASTEGGSLVIQTEQKHLNSLISGYSQIPPGEYVIVRVKDSGVGIPKENIKKIFEPYFSNKKMGKSGSGLGLAVVYGVVKDHYGYFDVFSELNKGTEFVLYFSVCSVCDSDKREQTSLIGGTESILVVDDLLEQRELFKDVLCNLGYTVSLAENGQEAIAFLKQQSVDIVLLDMILEPDFDGLDTYREILKVNPNQTCIVVSGYAETDRVAEMLQLGAGSYVRKPISIDAVGRAVREALSSRSYSLSE